MGLKIKNFTDDEIASAKIAAMQARLDLTLIFPIKDAASAAFMTLKAACLCEAGIITESNKEWVDARASSMLHTGAAIHLNRAAK
jgi:hypothetical protein